MIGIASPLDDVAAVAQLQPLQLPAAAVAACISPQASRPRIGLQWAGTSIVAAAIQVAVVGRRGERAGTAARHFAGVDRIDEFGRHDDQQFDLVDLVFAFVGTARR